MGSPFSPRASRSTKLQNRFKLEKYLSYADLHSEVMNDVNIMPPTSSGLHQKQHVRSKASENEELVKHMSKLPRYLERGEKNQDKALNIGVLDWRSLENWQYTHPQMPNRKNSYSPSSSNTSSSLLTDESSDRCRRRHSCSPAGLKGRRPTLQSYLNITPVEGHFEFVESSVGNASKFQDTKSVQSNPLDGQKNILREYQFFNKKFGLKTDLDLQSIPKTRTPRNFEKYGVPSSSKGKLKLLDDESTKESTKLQDKCNNVIYQDCPDGHKNVVLLLPRDGPGSSHSAISCPFDLTETNDQKSTESSRMSFSGDHFEELYHTELCSNISHSCPLPPEIDGIKQSQMEQHISIDALSVQFSSDPSHLPSSATNSASSARNKILEEKSTMMPIYSTVTKSSKGSDIKIGTVAATKVRNHSPTRRFSIGLGRIGRSSNSKDSAAVPQFSSKDVTVKSGAERAETSACSINSTSDKPNAISRGRSSPLRRLLDPLLKPKAANSHFAEQSQKDSTTTDRACTSFDGRGESSPVHPMKVKLDLTSLRTSNLDDSHHNEKHGSSTQQAYLQIAVKNDLPLFTFAVDNNSDVLAATIRKLSSSRKDDPTWIYTFFTIHEVKRKSGGWLNQGGKGKDYIPNVVAQMKVSDLPSSNLGGHHSADQFSTREFVLFAVDLRLFDQKTSDLQPNDELAAIVVKIPRKTIIGLKQDGKKSNSFSDLSAVGLKESSPDVRGSSNSREIHDNRLSVGSQDLFSTTVIVPGGVHGLPSKGEPSPLIERWKSGGLCDCGGWDLGCRVRVLANQNQNSMTSILTEAHKPTGVFELFSQSQEEVLKNTPFFSLSSLKNGIFSVEFDSSISLLQAFAICIAVLDSRKPSELQQLSNLFEEKLAKETSLLDNYGIKAPKQVRVNVPERYASHPPHSPVGRV